MKAISLPQDYTLSKRMVVALLGGSYFLSSYMLVGNFHLSSNQLPVEKLWADEIIPFLPSTVWIYFSSYFFVYAVFFIGKKAELINAYVKAFCWMVFFCNCIYYLVPTYIERHEYPLEDSLFFLTKWGFQTLRNIDPMYNCIPSTHVATSVLGALFFLHQSKKAFILFSFWASLIILSTLTTKQHYVYDVVSGMVVGIIFYWIFFHLRKPSESF